MLHTLFRQAFHDGFRIVLETRKTWSYTPEPIYEAFPAIPDLMAIVSENCTDSGDVTGGMICRPESFPLIDFTPEIPKCCVSWYPELGQPYTPAIIGGEVIIAADYDSYDYNSDPILPGQRYVSQQDSSKRAWVSHLLTTWDPGDPVALAGSPGGGDLVKIFAKVRAFSEYDYADAQIEVLTNTNLGLLSEVVARVRVTYDSTSASGFVCSPRRGPDSMHGGPGYGYGGYGYAGYDSDGPDLVVNAPTYKCDASGDHIIIAFWNKMGHQIESVHFRYEAPIVPFGEGLPNEGEQCQDTPCTRPGGLVLEHFNVSVQNCWFQEILQNFSAIAGKDDRMSRGEFSGSIYNMESYVTEFANLIMVASSTGCSDDISVDAGFGNCTTYASGHINQGFCILDSMCDRCGCTCASECSEGIGFGIGNMSSGGNVSMASGDDSCQYAMNEVCDDPGLCSAGTDFTDCRRMGYADDSCQYASNGVCDEPTLCSPGTDYSDCSSKSYADDSCLYAMDGECDDPGLCSPGTDHSDCIIFSEIDIDLDGCIDQGEADDFGVDSSAFSSIDLDQDGCIRDVYPFPWFTFADFDRNSDANITFDEWLETNPHGLLYSKRIADDSLDARSFFYVLDDEPGACEWPPFEFAEPEPPSTPVPTAPLGGLMGLEGQPCASDVCPDYVALLNKCVCHSCCADVNLAFVQHIAELSGVEACTEQHTMQYCSALELTTMLEIAGLNMSDFAEMRRVASGLTPHDFEMQISRLMRLDSATSSLRMGMPSEGSTPDSVRMEAALSCVDPLECDAAWSRFFDLVCSGYLAGNLTEAFGKPIEMDPLVNGCNITNTTNATTALAPALAAQAATTSAVVTAVVAASVAGSVAGTTIVIS